MHFILHILQSALKPDVFANSKVFFFKHFTIFGSAFLVQPSKVVKVHASLLLKDSLEVHLNNATRVADVLRQFQKNLCQNGWNIVNTVNLLKW